MNAVKEYKAESSSYNPADNKGPISNGTKNIHLL